MRFGDSKDIKVNVRLTQKEYDWLNELSSYFHMNVSSIIRVVIDSSMDEYGTIEDMKKGVR